MSHTCIYFFVQDFWAAVYFNYSYTYKYETQDCFKICNSNPRTAYILTIRCVKSINFISLRADETFHGMPCLCVFLPIGRQLFSAPFLILRLRWFLSIKLPCRYFQIKCYWRSVVSILKRVIAHLFNSWLFVNLFSPRLLAILIMCSSLKIFTEF